MHINRNIPETIEHLAHLYREIGDVTTSKSLIQQGKQIDNKYPDFYAQESELALLAGDLEEAEEEARNYLRLGADTVRAHTLIGQVYLCQGNWQRAKQAFGNALTYLPTSGSMESLSLQALASLADYQAGDTEIARNTWKEILKKIDDEDISSDPKQKQKVCLISSGILAQTGNMEQAIRCLQETPDLLPSAGILQVHPFFSDLKDEPAFQSLLDSLQHTADSIKVLVRSSDFRPQT
jgi:tetratricopeptide (TPR) repeat protein